MYSVLIDWFRDYRFRWCCREGHRRWEQWLRENYPQDRPRPHRIILESVDYSHIHHGLECPICLMEFEGGYLAKVNCSHWYHLECLQTWINTSYTTRCPICSAPIDF